MFRTEKVEKPYQGSFRRSSRGASVESICFIAAFASTLVDRSAVKWFVIAI